MFLQLLLKLASRQPEQSRRHGLGRDDLVWWLDWVVAAVIAFTVLGLNTARDHGSLSQNQIMILVVSFVAGLLALPAFVRTWGYAPPTDHDGRPALRTVLGILLPNLVGAGILLSAVVSGAQLAA